MSILKMHRRKGYTYNGKPMYQYEITIPKRIINAAKMRKGEKLQFWVVGEGSVLLSVVPADPDKRRPAPDTSI